MKKIPSLLTVSDMHLCHTAPPCRSREPNWYLAQKRYLDALKQLQAEFNVPVVVAGDIFDKWNPPHELVNFALAQLPAVYGIPGQHDLPHHSYSDIKKSAYWTLVEAGKIVNLEPNKPVDIGVCRLWGFPWGSELGPPSASHTLMLDIAVVHAFVYTKTTGFPGAPETAKVSEMRKKLKGYDVAVFGDNHKGFANTKSSPVILNNGTLMRRRSDEETYQPCVGLIYEDGSVERLPLEVDEVFERVEREKPKPTYDFSRLLKGLTNLSEVTCDFKEEIQRELQRRESSEQVRKVVWGSVENE